MPQPRKLKLVEAFDAAHPVRGAAQQSGFEMVDDLRVLERYFTPLLYNRFDATVISQQVTVTLFDFNAYTATITTQPVDKSFALQGSAETQIVPFSAFDNKNAIRDAHRALTALGGSPPPLDEINLGDLTTKGALNAPKTAQFGKKP